MSELLNWLELQKSNGKSSIGLEAEMAVKLMIAPEAELDITEAYDMYEITGGVWEENL